VKGRHAAFRYALGATAVALLAVAIGRLVVEPAAWVGVVAGAGAALVLQLGVFFVFGLLLFPTRRLVVFGLGMVLRMFSILVLALLAPVLGLPLAPTLFTLVGVFVLTSLLEPILLLSEPQRAS
jgi:hypothetical protein